MSTNFENSEEKIENIDEKYFDNLEQGMIEKNGIHVNPVLLRALDFNHAQAIMLSQYGYCAAGRNGKPFLYQDKNFMYSIGSLDKIMRTKKALKEKGLISVILKGLPASSYIVYNKDAVDNLKKQYIVDTYFSIPEYLRPDYDEKSRNKFMKKSINWNVKESINYYNKENNKDNIKENTKRNLETEKNIPASGSPSSPDVDELSAKISSIKPKKLKKLKDYEKDEVFLSIRKSLPEYMNGCGPVKAYKAYLKVTEKGTKNVEEIKKAITFYLKTLPEWQHPQHLSTFLNQGTWEEFYARAVEQEQKQEKARILREKQQKEEAEQRKRVLKERAQVFEAKYQVLKNKLNAGYDTLEEISQENEELFYDVIQQIRDYERKLEEKEAEIKRQQELEQKKIDAEKSKIALEEAERELWTYVSTKIDVQKFIEENKAIFPTTYEKLKALFANGETLLDVVFGEKDTEGYVHRLSIKILSSLFDKDENVKTLYNKSSEAWTKWNQLQKEII